MSSNEPTFTTLQTPKISTNLTFETFFSCFNDKICKKNSSENMIWCHEYSIDILASLKESEKRRRKLDFKSRQMSHRPVLLMLMEIVAVRLNLSRTTLHLGVYLLDGFMDTYTISLNKLNASALMCLLVAAKIEESDINIPKFEEFNDLVGRVYTITDFKTVEKKIITTFEFDFIYPTAATFVESYSNQIISYQDFLSHHVHHSNTHSSVFSSYELMMQECTEVLFNVLDSSLHDNRLVNFTPSVVGAACLATTRSIKKIQPVWTNRLIELTGYHYEQIKSIVEILTLLYSVHHVKKTEKVCDSPDSGIASDCNKSFVDSEEDDDDLVNYHPTAKRRRIFK